jgi:heme a synthase
MIYKLVKYWLIAGIVLVFVQVLIGGVTRLTNSGLSITEWNVIKGTLPPLNETEWNTAFDKYKTFANKQFTSLHADMDIKAFKKIYFWEYFHRLWARSMGFIFLFPFIFFVIKKWLSGRVVKLLLTAVFLAALAAVFGWIMVASGLNEDNRTWVSAYKLVMHLMIATALFGVLVYTYLVYDINQFIIITSQQYKLLTMIFIFTIIQIALGGLMAGMRAGLIHPELSVFINFENFRNLFSEQITQNTLVNYEASTSIKAFVQVFHRMTAFVILILGVLYYRTFEMKSQAVLSLMGVLIIQIILGLITITQCHGSVPAIWGVIHQGTALVFFGIVIWNRFVFNRDNI